MSRISVFYARRLLCRFCILVVSLGLLTEPVCRVLRFTTRLKEDIGVYERVLLHTTAIMHTEIVTGARINPKMELEEGRCCRLDPIAFLSLKENSYQENLKALDSVKFTRQPGYQDQHLDLGCGPANFTTEHLLPRQWPCKRIVATDKSRHMLDYARDHHQHPEVFFELLDIEHGDPQSIVDKHGWFDRVYAFLTFHYVSDLKRAYHNVHRLLKDGGECLVVYFTRTGITDAWYEVGRMDTWTNLIPDPEEVFARRFHFNKPVIQQEVVAEERRAVESAGLKLVYCRTYNSLWTLPTVDVWTDNYVKFFKLDARMHDQERSAFRISFRSSVLKRLISTSGGVALTHEVVLAHSQKPMAPSSAVLTWSENTH